MSLSYRDDEGNEIDIAGTPYEILQRVTTFRDVKLLRSYYQIDSTYNWPQAKLNQLADDLIDVLGTEQCHGTIMLANGYSYVGDYIYYNPEGDGSSDFYLSMTIHTYGDGKYNFSPYTEDSLKFHILATGTKSNIKYELLSNVVKSVTTSLTFTANTMLDTDIDIPVGQTTLVRVYFPGHEMGDYGACLTGIVSAMSGSNETQAYDITVSRWSHAYLGDVGNLYVVNHTNAYNNKVTLGIKLPSSATATAYIVFKRLV